MKQRLVDAWQGPILPVFLIALGTALRVAAIGRDSLWFDEAISYLASSLTLPEILNNTVQSSHPFLYYLALHAWSAVVPADDGWLRLLGALWGLLLIPATYLLALELLGRRSLAAWAALLVTISPFQVLFSHELRMYTQLMLLVTLGSYAYLRAVRGEKWYWWAFFVLCFGAAVYTHLFAWLVLAAVGIYTLIRYGWSRTSWQVGLAIGLLLLLFIPWLQQMAAERQKDLGSLRPLAQESSRNWLKPLTAPAFLVLGMSSRPWYVGLALFLTISTTIISALELRKAYREKAVSGLLLPLLVVAAVVALPLLINLARPFFLPERTMAAAAPFLAVFLAWGTTRRASPLPFLVYGAVALMSVGTLLYLTGGTVKPPYRDAIEYVAERRQAEDLILHTSDGSYLPALRYVNYEQHGLLDGDPDPRKPDAVYARLGGEVWSRDLDGSEGNRLWLIVALEHSLEWQEEQAAFFSERYRLLEQHSIGGITIRLYDLQTVAEQ